MPESDLERERAAHRDHIRRSLLESCEHIDEQGAWALLGKPRLGPVESMRSLVEEGSVLGLLADGQIVYPTFQFDPDAQAVPPGMTALLQAKPETYSAYMLLHWLLRPHLEFDGPPVDSLRDQPTAVLGAFYREISPVTHG